MKMKRQGMIYAPHPRNGIYVAPEPILAPFLLRQKIPVLVGISYFLVAFANFSVMYSFPMWFETVKLTSASEAGE